MRETAKIVKAETDRYGNSKKMMTMMVMMTKMPINFGNSVVP
jgi:hypothetical protein